LISLVGGNGCHRSSRRRHRRRRLNHRRVGGFFNRPSFHWFRRFRLRLDPFGPGLGTDGTAQRRSPFQCRAGWSRDLLHSATATATTGTGQRQKHQPRLLPGCLRLCHGLPETEGGQKCNRQDHSGVKRGRGGKRKSWRSRTHLRLKEDRLPHRFARCSGEQSDRANRFAFGQEPPIDCRKLPPGDQFLDIPYSDCRRPRDFAETIDVWNGR
jgi:hypothetical protein